ncbi:guanine nucleotide-releasing factor 2 isoform X3 [Atheta coriaria]|uniref:guanine nucleotide-releasing factor 2 isoform X3 n=1 Tax=Dalotia coriaria TaxID=877792 RepID=UPI0031F3B8AE
MTSTPKTAGKHVPQECESASPSPLAGGHKASFKNTKSTKLARRARSFKDEFLEKISAMRSPGGIGVRSASPKGRPIKHHEQDVDHAHAQAQIVLRADKGPAHEFDALAKQIQVTLKHFLDVISKNKLEMLPGNGTIVLDTVWHINLLVKSSMGDDYSPSVRSATHRMYQSVARLIKLCDDALLDTSCLEEKTVAEVVQVVEDSVKDLIRLCQERIAHTHAHVTHNAHKSTARNSYANISTDMNSQRNSLPDIPLTPREREILEQTSRNPGMVRGSHSSESILRDSTPPPKPPLPGAGTPPPPLPPKTRQRIGQHARHLEFDTFNSSLERVSLHSRSPEDSSSLLSASGGSMDSVLNQSREEEEISALMDQNVDDSDTALENDLHDIEDGNCYGSNGNCNWDDTSDNCYITLTNQRNDHHVNHFQYNRLSNTDSGIVSIDSQSQRNSSCSKRSSQQSTHWSHSTTTKSSSITSSSLEMTKSESVVQNLSQVVETTSSTTSSSISTMSKNSLMLQLDEVDGGLLPYDENTPPAIPMKTRRNKERLPSPYDNVPEVSDGEKIVTCLMHQSQQSLSTSASISSSICVDNGKPPPLPPKKKHMFQSVAYSVMAYMEMFGNCSHNNDQEFMRHSMHVAWPPSPTPPGLPTTQSCSFAHTTSRTAHSQMHSLIVAHPSGDSSPISSPMKSPNLPPTPQSAGITGLPPALPPRKSRNSYKSPPSTPQSTISSVPEIKTPVEPLPDLLENTPKSEDEQKDEETELDLMEETDIAKYLIRKKPEDDGYDIRGGTIDALIIEATKGSKSGYSYQEAFLTTYRTFVTPFDLIGKLIRRYNYFYCQPDKKPRSRESFALLVRVVNDLTANDLDSTLQQKLMDFVQLLITGGELTLAKALRVKLIEKHLAKELSQRKDHHNTLHTVGLLGPGSCTILDFKSEQIAEQMTLLDAELFQKIEIPEVLIWAQEQNEERSKNLTRFTEHFNKMSYWARTRILECDGKDREKYFMKFIKIMKHLRKINNFNSYLALLSALDSAPVRRLEWQKHVQEGLKEYCALIDSSSSFRAYRQALANASPPCIPYIGLVLQDLTFVHIGNSNLLPNNYINFSKRCQQHNIVENMKDFKKCLSNSSTTYTFKKNDRIIAFFGDFEQYISEDAMWQMSENIKPRGGKKTAT